MAANTDTATCIGVDLGRKTGVCIMRNRCKPKLMTWNYTKLTHSQMFCEFTTDITECFDNEWMNTRNNVVVAFEDVQFMTSRAQTNIWSGLRAILMVAAAKAGFDLHPIPVGTLKKYAAGNGNASKEDMMKIAQSLGVPVADDNQADALFLARYAQCLL